MNPFIKGLLVAALGLVLAGLAVGLVLPVHDDSGYKCGTAFRNTDDRVGEASNCSEQRNEALRPAVVLLILGAALGLGALVTDDAQRDGNSAPAAPESDPL